MEVVAERAKQSVCVDLELYVLRCVGEYVQAAVF